MTVPHASAQNNEASLKNKMTILIFGVKDTGAFVNISKRSKSNFNS
jgi:hypothetical protein